MSRDIITISRLGSSSSTTSRPSVARMTTAAISTNLPSSSSRNYSLSKMPVTTLPLSAGKSTGTSSSSATTKPKSKNYSSSSKNSRTKTRSFTRSTNFTRKRSSRPKTKSNRLRLHSKAHRGRISSSAKTSKDSATTSLTWKRKWANSRRQEAMKTSWAPASSGINTGKGKILRKNQIKSYRFSMKCRNCL